MSLSADPTDEFIRQLEALRPQILRAQQRGERIRIKLYAAGEVGPPEFRSLYWAKSQGLVLTS